MSSTARADLLAPEAPYSLIENLPGNVSFVDFSDYFCTEDLCLPVIGNVHVYLDDNHVSGTYMGTMAPIVERELVARLTEESGGVGPQVLRALGTMVTGLVLLVRSPFVRPGRRRQG